MALPVNLDDSTVYLKTDPGGMLDHLHNFPRLCQQAWQMALAFDLPASYLSKFNKVVFLGMGGSAIGGDLVASLSLFEAKIPILVSREYNLPFHIDSDALIIASSYSGQTEETLSAFAQALKSPGKKLAITSGGKMAELCRQANIPCLRFNYPSQPRAALPFSFFLSLGILQKLAVIPDKSAEAGEAFTSLQSLSDKINEKVKTGQNPAKSLANRLYGRIPVIYGAGITSEVAHRWKTQINENSKTTAFYELFSELNHNAIVGYEFPQELASQVMMVFLNSNVISERNRRRFEITQQLLTRQEIPFGTVHGEGRSALSQMLTLVLFGDYVSYYLAMLNRADPTPVKSIDFLKEQLGNF